MHSVRELITMDRLFMIRGGDFIFEQTGQPFSLLTGITRATGAMSMWMLIH